MGTKTALGAFEPVIDQIERNLRIAIEMDYPGREQLLAAIAGQLECFGQAILDLSQKARIAGMRA